MAEERRWYAQNIKTPSGSYEVLVPKCSIFGSLTVAKVKKR